MERIELIQKLLSGYLIKLTGGKYSLVSEENRGHELEQLKKKDLENIQIDIVDESKRNTFFCIDISFFGHDLH